MHVQRGGLLSCRNHWSLGQNCPSVCVAQAERNASKTRGGNREGGRWELRRGDGQMGTARLADLQVKAGRHARGAYEGAPAYLRASGCDVAPAKRPLRQQTREAARTRSPHEGTR
jgi:hypothetical protein